MSLPAPDKSPGQSDAQSSVPTSGIDAAAARPQDPAFGVDASDAAWGADATDVGVAESPQLDAAADAGPPSDASLVADAADARASDLCRDGFARGDASMAMRRIAAFTPSPEGVAVCPGGDVFVSVDGPDEIRRVPLDGGAPELYASLAGFQPAGITCDERGRLFVAGFSRRDGSPSPPILMVSAKGAPAIALPLPADYKSFGFNGIAAIEGIGVFASDTGAGGIVRARELADGGFETVLAASDMLGGNGIAYHPNTRTLYVVVSFLPARVVSFRVAQDGSLQGPKTEGTSDLLTLFDGIAVDAQGALYIADYLGGKLLRSQGRERVALAALSDPASLAFLGGTLLVTSYHLNDTKREGGLYALEVGACGP